MQGSWFEEAGVEEVDGGAREGTKVVGISDIMGSSERVMLEGAARTCWRRKKKK